MTKTPQQNAADKVRQSVYACNWERDLNCARTAVRSLSAANEGRRAQSEAFGASGGSRAEESGKAVTGCMKRERGVGRHCGNAGQADGLGREKGRQFHDAKIFPAVSRLRPLQLPRPADRRLATRNRRHIIV